MLTPTFNFPFILDKEENCRIFVILFISTRQGTCLVSWQAFYACPDASYGGFVPPCGVLMHPLPSQGETQRESGTFFVYKFSVFGESSLPVFYWSIVIVLFK